MVKQTASGRCSKRCGTGRRNPESHATQCDGLEAPAGDGFGEIFRVLVLAKGDLRYNAEDAAAGRFEKGANVAAIFAVVDFDELLPEGGIFDFLNNSFEDDGFVGFFCANDNSRVRGKIFCFAGARTGAEPEGVLPPDSPNKHEMRAATGARRGNPIFVGLSEALEGPGPGLETA